MSNKKFTLKCEEANHVCDKSQYKEASIWEKIKLNIHLLYCKACRKYSKNNAKLSTLFKTSQTKVLATSEKEKLKTVFEKELEKHKEN